MVGSLCTASSASSRAGGRLLLREGSRVRGHVHPLSDMVQEASFPQGGRKARVHWKNFFGNPLSLGKSCWFWSARCQRALVTHEGFPAHSLGQVGWRHLMCTVLIRTGGVFWLLFVSFSETQISFSPGCFLPTSSSKSQLCVTLSPCFKLAVFEQLSVADLSMLMTNSFQEPLHTCCLLSPLGIRGMNKEGNQVSNSDDRVHHKLNESADSALFS